MATESTTNTTTIIARADQHDIDLHKASDRVTFGSIKDPIDVPYLLGVQPDSFDWLIGNERWKARVEEDEKTGTTAVAHPSGLDEVFNEISPIENFAQTMSLTFSDPYFEEPRHTVQECKEKDYTYSAPLSVSAEFENGDTGEIKSQTVFMGDFPLQTPHGTFIIGGTERVIVSQLVRSPGVYFDRSQDRTSDKEVFGAKIIPRRGAWLEFEIDKRDVLGVRVDRKRKQSAIVFLMAIGMTKDEIADAFRDYPLVMDALAKETVQTQDEALTDLYRKIRPADTPTPEAGRNLLDSFYFNTKRYDLARVGRYKINRKHGLEKDVNDRSLSREDIISTIKYLVTLHAGDTKFPGKRDGQEVDLRADVADIDHNGNRRIRQVGELIQNQLRTGLSRMERVVRERMTTQDPEAITPQSLINIRPVNATIKEFFGTSQLSQFMDQTNPLSEITHKRRLSALGPGGLSRDRAGFEVRDVHYTHYGRLCPIESPEGPNIGLISSLCVYAKISDMGFIETPYRTVTNGQVDLNNADIKYYSAEEEEGQVVAQSNVPIDDEGHFLQPDRIKAREGADFPVVTAQEVTLMDVAPNQIASIAASLIPFLEHDDANRALMGSNMLRQAVPLVTCESPIVGTGIEKDMISDSRIQIIAEGDGEVVFADATKIQIKYQRTEEEVICSFEPEITTYELPRYRRTNQNTSITLKPAVLTGDKVTKGQILPEGYSTQKGELALGRNLKVAFMPWKGYNFEDAIVISERIQREDIFTSVHVDEYIMEVRDTKRGVEELTSDIPNVSEDATKDLDANGIIRIGANVHPGDILIGKITPKGESDPSPEEKLLRAIFGDKAGDVKDASLKAQPSLHGVVIDTKLYSRAGKENKRAGKSSEKLQIEKLDEKFAAQVADLTKQLVNKLYTLLQGKTTTGITDYFGVELYPAGTKFTQKLLDELSRKVTDEKSGVAMGYLNLGTCKWTGDSHLDALVEKTINNYTIEWKKADAAIKREKYNLTNGDELPQTGVIQMAKVYIAKKRKLKVGDKMAGRHGNKGIVARVVRDEDMPFLEDGTIVDICLNPLGVPSRMNLGQIYETVLGWAGKELGLKFATPIFDGASLDQINEYTAKAGIPRSGRTYLYDGGTGEKFDQPATVGVIYMLKLGHMIDDKMHARSIGPYSLISQQPLGVKAQFGGQRFGEMEVWALEGFGAANILQEILTIKSDDVMGRAKAYEAIVKGDNLPKPGIPEAMNVLLHELRGLALSVKLE